jgi:hypothetical protein
MKRKTGRSTKGGRGKESRTKEEGGRVGREEGGRMLILDRYESNVLSTEEHRRLLSELPIFENYSEITSEKFGPLIPSSCCPPEGLKFIPPVKKLIFWKHPEDVRINEFLRLEVLPKTKFYRRFLLDSLVDLVTSPPSLLSSPSLSFFSSLPVFTPRPPFSPLSLPFLISLLLTVTRIQS